MTTDAGASRAQRFDVVLRGYDRRQVDEHVTRLQRVLARMRADLELARSQPIPAVPQPGGFAGGYNGQGGPGSNGPGYQGPGSRGPGQQGAPGGRSRPAPRPRPVQPPTGAPTDMIGTFTDRMQSILQNAEEEAAEIRRKAAASARAESESVRAELAGLLHKRDTVLTELTRLRAQLEGLLGAPTTRMTVPPRDVAPGPEQPDLGVSDQAMTTPGVGPQQPARDTAPRPTPVRASLTQAPSLPTTGAAGIEREGSSDAASAGSSDTAATGSGPASAAVVRQAAHRMPTGAYPAVAGRPSMRPRTEPDAEPGDLFRPASGAAGRAAADRSIVDDRTVMVPTVSAVDAVDADAAGESTGRDSATEGDPGSTTSTPPDQVPVMIGPPRPTAPSDATVLTPVVQPSSALTGKEDVPTEEPVASAGPAPDGDGAERVDHVPSSSRSG